MVISSNCGKRKPALVKVMHVTPAQLCAGSRREVVTGVAHGLLSLVAPGPLSTIDRTDSGGAADKGRKQVVSQRRVSPPATSSRLGTRNQTRLSR